MTVLRVDDILLESVLDFQKNLAGNCYSRFWLDLWCGNVARKNEFPQLHLVPFNKLAFVWEVFVVSG